MENHGIHTLLVRFTLLYDVALSTLGLENFGTLGNVSHV